MRLIDADALLNSGYPTIYHTEFGDQVINTDDIRKAPTINPFEPIPAETMYKIMDSEFEASNSFWIETPKGKKIEFEKVRPRGHWQVIGYHADKYFYCKCSNCQKKTKVFYDKTNPGEFGSLADIRRNVNFCMFCGADMREGREDET